MEKLSYKKTGLVGIHIEMIIARNLHWLFHIYLILTIRLHYYNTNYSHSYLQKSYFGTFTRYFD